MSHIDLDSNANDFAARLTESLDDSHIYELINSLNNGDVPAHDIFKSGFAMGSKETYLAIMPRAMAQGRTLKSVYLKLDAMLAKHEDVAFLADLSALRGEIAAYLITEAEAVLQTTRAKLSSMSGVPEEYVDDKTLIADIPASVLAEVGRKAAVNNMRLFAIFAVSGCKSTKEGKTMTMEQLIDLVQSNKITIVEDVNRADFTKLLPSYGSAQVRKVRDAYRKVLVSLDQYRQAQSTDAKRVTEDVIEKMKKGEKP